MNDTGQLTSDWVLTAPRLTRLMSRDREEISERIVQLESKIRKLAKENRTAEARLSKMEEAKIRIGIDDEYVHGSVFHMERMHEGHIWFRIGDEAFDLYAPDGNRLTWIPQASGGWEALAAEALAGVEEA